MWMHADSSNYGDAKVGVATSDTVCGKYNYIGSFRPLGFESRDMGLFKDDDGKAYLLTEDVRFSYPLFLRLSSSSSVLFFFFLLPILSPFSTPSLTWKQKQAQKRPPHQPPHPRLFIHPRHNLHSSLSHCHRIPRPPQAFRSVLHVWLAPDGVGPQRQRLLHLHLFVRSLVRLGNLRR